MDAKAFQVHALSRQSCELLNRFNRKNAGQSWQKYIARSWQQDGWFMLCDSLAENLTDDRNLGLGF
jgi:hypothetical protein